MLNSSRALNQLSSLNEKNSSESISRDSLFSSLHFNQFANQFSWDFLTLAFNNNKRILREIINKIFINYLLLVLREKNEYVK